MNLSRPTGERMAFTRRGPVVAAVGAYPFGLIVEQAASAVAAGCPVVAKPAFKTPLAFLAFLGEAGLPTEQAAATDGETVAGTLAAGTGFFPSSARLRYARCMVNTIADASFHMDALFAAEPLASGPARSLDDGSGLHV